jgi:hypothetical protein
VKTALVLLLLSTSPDAGLHRPTSWVRLQAAGRSLAWVESKDCSLHLAENLSRDELGWVRVELAAYCKQEAAPECCPLAVP